MSTWSFAVPSDVHMQYRSKPWCRRCRTKQWFLDTHCMRVKVIWHSGSRAWDWTSSTGQLTKSGIEEGFCPIAAISPSFDFRRGKSKTRACAAFVQRNIAKRRDAGLNIISLEEAWLVFWLIWGVKCVGLRPPKWMGESVKWHEVHLTTTNPSSGPVARFFLTTSGDRNWCLRFSWVRNYKFMGWMCFAN